MWMKAKNFLKDLLEGNITIPDSVWDFAWSKGKKQKMRFRADALVDAIKLNDEFALVRLSGQKEAVTDKTTASAAVD